MTREKQPRKAAGEEIRMRAVTPEFLTLIQSFSTRFGTDQTTQLIIKIVERYDAMEKRVDELNKENGQLARQLKMYKNHHANLGTSIVDLIDMTKAVKQTVNNYADEVQIALKQRWSDHTKFPGKKISPLKRKK